MIEIKEVTNEKALKTFVKFPIRLYKKNPYYVPFLFSEEYETLKKDTNPAFQYCESKYWIAYDNGKTVGRIAAIINYSYIEKWGVKSGRFGYVDFINNFKVAEELFITAEKWLKSKGMDYIQGPLGFCDLDPAGMLVDGFNKFGTLTTIYNDNYYMDFIEKLGYEKEVDWFEYRLKIPKKIPDKIRKMTSRALEMNELKVFTPKKKKDYLPYLKEIFELINDAYKDISYTVPLTDKQIEYYIKQYFSILTVDTIRIILDKHGKLAAFGIGMPSLAKAIKKSKGKVFPYGFIHLLKAMKFNDTMELMLIAVREDLQSKGVNAILLSEVVKICNKRGIKYADCNPQLESNTKVRSQWKYFSEHQTNKVRRSYIKNIS